MTGVDYVEKKKGKYSKMRVEVERLVLRHMTANSYIMVKKTYHITTKKQQQQQQKKRVG